LLQRGFRIGEREPQPARCDIVATNVNIGTVAAGKSFTKWHDLGAETLEQRVGSRRKRHGAKMKSVTALLASATLIGAVAVGNAQNTSPPLPNQTPTDQGEGYAGNDRESRSRPRNDASPRR